MLQLLHGKESTRTRPRGPALTQKLTPAPVLALSRPNRTMPWPMPQPLPRPAPTPPVTMRVPK
jgi:hypothetical protein